jgi:starvation-inducible DNA-binding protein
MKKQVYIDSKELQQAMNHLLSDSQVYYQNLRAFHWLVKGNQFFELHAKFEEYYTQAADDIDEIAERIMMIGGKPLHTFEDYMEFASISPKKDLENLSEIIPAIINNVEHLLSSYRNIAEIAAESGDRGTEALMDDFIGAAEKQLWMLNSLSIGVGASIKENAAYAS